MKKFINTLAYRVVKRHVRSIFLLSIIATGTSILRRRSNVTDEYKGDYKIINEYPRQESVLILVMGEAFRNPQRMTCSYEYEDWQIASWKSLHQYVIQPLRVKKYIINTVATFPVNCDSSMLQKMKIHLKPSDFHLINSFSMEDGWRKAVTHFKHLFMSYDYVLKTRHDVNFAGHFIFPPKSADKINLEKLCHITSDGYCTCPCRRVKDVCQPTKRERKVIVGTCVADRFMWFPKIYIQSFIAISEDQTSKVHSMLNSLSIYYKWKRAFSWKDATYSNVTYLLDDEDSIDDMT